VFDTRPAWQIPLVLAILSSVTAVVALALGWSASRTLTPECAATAATHSRDAQMWVSIAVSAVLGIVGFAFLFFCARPPTAGLYAVVLLLVDNLATCFASVVGSEPCIRITHG